MKPFVLLATRDHDKAARDEYESVRLHAGLAPDELVHDVIDEVVWREQLAAKYQALVDEAKP